MQLAVHIAGQLASERLPVVCLAGYHRNMADFTELAALLPDFAGGHWPVVLIDLRGRGRSPDRARADAYGTVADAEDVSEVTRALGLEAAIFLGEGHGGQVIMALAAQRPTLVGGAVLVNSGPVTVAQSLVRLRGNLESIAALKGKAGITTMLRRMLAAEYPGATPEVLDRLAGRTHYIDSGGRPWPLFDAALLSRFADLGFDDRLAPQWPLVHQLLVRVETSAGLVGWGEGFGHAACAATRTALETLFVPLVEGAPADDIAGLQTRLRRTLYTYGLDGPMADYAALGPTMEMAAGMAALIGYPGGQPEVTGPSYLDPIGGFNGAAAVLTALLHRQRTGEGQHLEISQVEAAMQFIGAELLAAAETGVDPPRDGNHRPDAAPHDDRTSGVG